MSDPTRFDLDERQRAMLAEMGVRVWWPQTPAEAPTQTVPVAALVPEPVVVAAAPLPEAVRAQAPAAAVAPVGAQALPLPAGVEQMDWATLQTTVASCQACGLCQGRKSTVFGVGDSRARWMVVCDESMGQAVSETEQPYAGPEGKLLDNMLKAVGLSRQDQGGVFITPPFKCASASGRNPEPTELTTCEAYLARQVALVQPQIIVAMGRFATQTLLKTTEPLGKLRGQVHRYQGVPVVATYHPASLLRTQADKAKAWADLLLALKTVQG